MNAIKALGNSMCVEVVFEIFYGIERTERKLRRMEWFIRAWRRLRSVFVGR
ncbi:MAG: hypothetical protein LUD72_01450 [Bacteroidales bacterium]|nr:hypothetical protein [Bacteroidales bacterium]